MWIGEKSRVKNCEVEDKTEISTGLRALQGQSKQILDTLRGRNAFNLRPSYYLCILPIRSFKHSVTDHRYSR